MIRRHLALIASIALAACGDEPVKWHTWEGSSEVVFIDAGSKTVQSLGVGCRWTTGGSQWFGGTGVRENTEVPWLARHDGSILVMDSIEPCRGRATGPRDMEPQTAEGGLYDPRLIDLHHRTWLFDNAVRPTRVDAFSTSAMMTSEGPLRIERITRGSKRFGDAKRLIDVFPGLPDQPGIGLSRGLGRHVRYGSWLGVQATVWRVRKGEFCGSNPDPSCGEIVRYLKTESNADFTRLELLTEETDSAYRATYFHPRVLLDRHVKLWTPEVCINEQCKWPSEPVSGSTSGDHYRMWFDGPGRDESVALLFSTHSFNQTVFPGRKAPSR